MNEDAFEASSSQMKKSSLDYQWISQKSCRTEENGMIYSKFEKKKIKNQTKPNQHKNACQ